jgi:hypothetical protein
MFLKPLRRTLSEQQKKKKKKGDLKIIFSSASIRLAKDQ